MLLSQQGAKPAVQIKKPTMTIFELIKLTLDELYQEGLAEYGAALDAQIKARIIHLSNSYKSLTSTIRLPIDYRDPATRFAYVFMYVAAHGDYLVKVLDVLRSVSDNNVFQEEVLRLSCIGGGPGSDIIGLLKYLADNSQEPVKKITCYLLDGEQGWADTWTEIGDSLTSDLAVSVHFQKLDVTDPTSWSSQKKFLKANIFTLSYFVSEVFSFDKGAVTDFWRKIFDESNVGAIFIYTDNGSPSFNAYFDKQWKSRTDLGSRDEVSP